MWADFHLHHAHLPHARCLSGILSCAANLNRTIAAQVRSRVPDAGAAARLLQGGSGGSGAAAAAPEGWVPAPGEEVAVLSMPASATGRVLSLAGSGKGKATVKARYYSTCRNLLLRGLAKEPPFGVRW